MSEVPLRALPHVAWPAYAYLPGRDPHPVLDARGHSFGQRECATQAADPDQWSSCTLYLRGVDLYNHGYHWEAHEAWEALWHVAFDAVQHGFLQGLIQAAAAVVQQRLGHEQGRARLARRAAAHLQEVLEARGARYMGLELPALITALEEFADTGAPPPVLAPRF